ncbi:MAG: hypothetical protein U1D41_04370 [Nitrosomonas sp.]|uniref:hypothetical protein n=1 Tax=Nitrosomonas sp. TaxID=42353 RepID=UPI002751895A|nr:hypothetical protein [Nitrosomonas sp.]MDP3662847.1 hypothetical protein [Nitrosomonas sp.]MDZ4105391.1 hypothetical protein [Nitrosomonas sp.]
MPLKNFLPLASLLFFQFLDLLLDFMLFIEISRKPGLPLLNFDLLFGIFERLFSGKYHVVCPFFQFLPRFIEKMVIRFQRLTDCGSGMPLCFCCEFLRKLLRYINFA